MTADQRYISLTGAYNVREVGGYATRNGRETKWKTFLSAEFDNLMDAGAATTDLEERAEIYNEASQILNEQLPSLFLMTQNNVWAVDSNIEGFTGSAGGYITWNLSDWTLAG